MKHAVVIGAGPAGLMAAEMLANAGLRITLCDAKPSVGRKLLMAGKSGLNLTKDAPAETFLAAYAEAGQWLQPAITAFDGNAVQDWARGLGQEVFTGSTGRVFPVAMKASPLLRAWLARLAGSNVAIQPRWRWTGWDGEGLSFATPDGPRSVSADVTVLALGGASWARLGSDGHWTGLLADRGVALAPFQAANAGVAVDWSDYMQAHFGAPLKGIALSAGPYLSRGEATLSRHGLEGGGVYTVSRGVREGYPLLIDLLPDLSIRDATAQLTRPQGKASLANHLRKTLKLSPVQIALAQEMARPLPDGVRALARQLKALPIRHNGLRPIDEAISTAGGIAHSAVDAGLMLTPLPGVFVAGEMLDWEAPTGGYLISACLATGRWAGQHAAQWALKT